MSSDRHSLCRSALSALLLQVLILAACGSVPRVKLDLVRVIGEAVGEGAEVKVVAAGPDGGLIDEPDPAGDLLTLTDALRRDLATDPGLQAAMARVQIARADADQARLLPNPVLNVVVRTGSGRPQVEASLAEDFLRAMQVRRRASAADHRLHKAVAEAVVVAIDAVSEVQERYLRAQAAAQVVPLLRERSAILEQLEAVASSSLDAGEGTLSDLVTLQAQRVGLAVELDQAVLEARDERLHLARLIGEPSGDAAWKLDPWVAPGVAVESESAWIGAALVHRPEIQVACWELRALGDEGALAGFFSWEGTSVGIDTQRDDGWSGGPSVSTPLPLFDVGQAARVRATAEQMEARHELTLVRRRIVEEVRVAHQALVASNANLVRIRDDLIPLQRRRRALAEEAYRAGQSDVTGVFLAEHDLRVTQAKAIEVEHQAALALIRLQRAVGGPGAAAALLTASGTTNPESEFSGTAP